jgi:predicted nucleic acid-binding protein
VVNWGEVYYTIARARGFAETDKIMNRVRMLPLAIRDADEATTTAAARLKAGHGLPYADCFAAALAQSGEILVTSDAKDFRKIPRLHILALPEHKG